MRLKLKTITSGIFNGFLDLILWEIGAMLGSIGKSGSIRDMYQTYEEASDFLDKHNHQTFKNLLSKLKRQGLIEIIKDEGYYKIQITNIGKQKINSLLPVYQKKRPWNRKLYLITYDIPERSKKQRNTLRNYLKKLGAGLLQKSVWLSPYNIKNLLDEFINQNHIQGMIILSSIGKDGSIGDTSLEELIIQIYELENLNQRYKEFFDLAKKTKSKQFLSVQYLSVLKDDPQIPFELLPDWWKGDDAYRIYEKIIKCSSPNRN